MKISFVILTKNEEKNIERCLDSIKNYADEIIVLDEFSNDKTVEIAKKYQAIVIQNKNGDDFSAARNLGTEKTKNEWCFFIDCDEELVGKIGEIGEIGEIGGIAAYRIKRKDNLWGTEIKHGENGLWNEIRLLKKGSGKWVGKVHERYIVNENCRGTTCCAPTQNAYLKHYPHQTMREFLDEINKYSDLRAAELFEEGVKSDVWQIALYPLGKFIVDYVLLLGFLDGTRGFVIAAMMSFYSFLVRSKLYMLYNHSEKATS